MQTIPRSVILLLVFVLPVVASSENKADQIIVNKSKRELLLLREGKVVKSYKVSLGRSAVGSKARQGDGKTPEGAYIISGRNAASAYHKSLRISYPSVADRERAKRRGINPGGDIMIHGLPNGKGYLGAAHRLVDWTDGCIAVTDAEIEEIWMLVADGTPIRINP